jgi:hypothetical protein
MAPASQNGSRVAYLMAAGGVLFTTLGFVLLVGAQLSAEFRFAIMGLGDSILPLLGIGVCLLFFGWLLRPVYIR